MLSPNRYTAEALQTQHANEKPWTTQQNATQPAPEQSVESTPVSAVVYAALVPPSPEEMASNPTKDFAHVILAADTRLDDETRANAWDLYHAAATPDELIRNLSPLEIPDTTRQTLLAAKQVTAAAVTPVEKAANALRQMANVDPQTLEVAETFPKLTKMVIDAAVRSEE
jgi:hypothetical protein